jgi:hypothetical protein
LIAVNIDNMDVCCKEKPDNRAISGLHGAIPESEMLTIDEMFSNMLLNDAMSGGVKKFLKMTFDDLSKICEQIEARGLEEDD